MAAFRRVLLGLAFLAAALGLSHYSAGLSRSAWFAKMNAMAGAALCGGIVVTLLCQSLRVSESRFNAAWWKVTAILLPIGVALMWLSLIVSPGTASKPLSWLLTLGTTMGWLLFLRIKKTYDRSAARIE